MTGAALAWCAAIGAGGAVGLAAAAVLGGRSAAVDLSRRSRPPRAPAAVGTTPRSGALPAEAPSVRGRLESDLRPSGGDRPAGAGWSAGAPPAGAARRRAHGRLVLVVAGGLALIVAGPTGALALGAAAMVGTAVVRRAAVRRHRRAVERAVPELVDLLRVAAAAGHPVRGCVDAVADRSPPSVRAALARARQRADLGLPLVEALRSAAPDLGEFGPAVVDALIAAQVTGAPLVPALDRLAVAARDRRRRAAEEEARRLPVALLFPLVCCVLPAFGLLAVVPLLAASLESLRLP